MVVDETAYALAQSFPTKINQQPHGLPGQAKIGQKRLGVNGCQPFDRFDFNDQALVNHQIDLECSIDPHTFKLDVDAALTRDRIAHGRQSGGQHKLIDAFQKTRAQFAMQSQRDIDHISTDEINVSHGPDPPLRPPRLCGQN
jgi:hypothetical protein